jgi:hypothetical protein
MANRWLDTCDHFRNAATKRALLMVLEGDVKMWKFSDVRKAWDDFYNDEYMGEVTPEQRDFLHKHFASAFRKTLNIRASRSFTQGFHQG